MKRNLKVRIVSFLLCLLMVFTSIPTYAAEDTLNTVETDQNILDKKEDEEIAVTGITLNADSAELKVGETVTLEAWIAPENATDKTITWESSDETVATVADGVVTAVTEGTANITAKAGEHTAVCAVTVNAADAGTGPTSDSTEASVGDYAVMPVEDVAVENVTLDKSVSEVEVGNTVELTATVTPEDATDKTVTWESSDTTVATVANGVVTALAAGTATITVKTTDGEKTASCEVTVKAVPVKTDYDISTENVEITADGEYTVTGSTTSNSIKIADGVTAKITLKNVSIKLSGGNGSWNISDISVAGKPAIALGEGSEVTLKLVGDNSVKSGEGRAGIEVPGERIHKNGATATAEVATLIIEGDGSLTAQAGNAGAGIGGSLLMDAGNIIINSGNIVAKGTSGDGGSGIGGGHSGNNDAYGSFKSVTINGGTVDASGPHTCSGIGLGSHAQARGSVINITGGVVTATGGTYSDNPDDIGKGHGNGNDAPVVTISGNAVVNCTKDRLNKRKSGTVNRNGGIIIEGTKVNMYGDVTLGGDFILPSGTSLAIPAGMVLTVPTDTTLTVNGTIIGDGTVKILGGTVVNAQNITAGQEKFAYYIETAVNPEKQTYNKDIKLTATVKKEADSTVATDIQGTVTFSKDGTALGTAQLVDGVASLTVKADWAAAEYTIKAAVAVNSVGISSTAKVTVEKATQTTAPAAPVKTTEITINSITLEPVTGEGVGEIQYGYAPKAAEGETQQTPANWQSNTKFTNLWPDTTYIFYSRFAGDSYYDAIVSATGLEVTTTALPTLSAPTLEQPLSSTFYAVELKAPEKCQEIDTAVVQYQMSSDGGATWSSWGTSTKYEKLSEGKEYQFRARYAVTAYNHYSPESNVVKVTVQGIILPEENHDVPTGETAVKNKMIFSNINVSGVKVLKHSYDAEKRRAILLVAPDTDKLANVTFVADCHQTAPTITSSKVGAYYYYQFVGNTYPVDGSQTDAKWVYTYKATDDTNKAKSRPQEYFKWSDQGRAVFTFETAYNGSTSEQYRQKYTVELWISGTENIAPAVRPDVEDTAEFYTEVGETYSVILEDIFEDADLDELSYTVSVNGAEQVKANSKYYAYSPSKEGVHILKFFVKDINGAVCEKPYTVKIHSYKVKEVPTGGTKNDNWNPDMEKIYLGGVGVNNIIKSQTENNTFYIVLDKNTKTTDTIFVKADVLTDSNWFSDKGAMHFNGTKVSGVTTSVSAKKAVWRGTYTPQWNEKGEAVLQIYGSVNNKESDYKYTLKFKIADDANKAPVVANAEINASIAQYNIYTADFSSMFSDSDDSWLLYYVSVNGGELQECGKNYEYVPLTVGTHTLQFTAVDPVGNSAESTVILTVSDYVCPDDAFYIGNTSSDGALLYVRILDRSNSNKPIEGATYSIKKDESGKNIIDVILPEGTNTSIRVRAEYGIVQNADKVPFMSSYYAYNSAFNRQQNYVDTNLRSGKGTSTALYWYETVPTKESNVYETYQINYQVIRENNQKPALKDPNVTATEWTLKQYEEKSIDLSKIFVDPENDSMTYMVSVDNGTYRTVNQNYIYEANIAGTHTLVFKAKDCLDAVSDDTYTVTVNVSYVPRFVVKTNEETQKVINGKNTSLGVITEFEVFGIETDEVFYTKQNDTNRTIAVRVDETVTNQIAEIAHTANNAEKNNVVCEPANQIQLVNGEGTVKVTSTCLETNEAKVYTIIFTKAANNAPEISNKAKDEANVVIGESYQVNVAEMFTDKDGDALSYTVKENGKTKTLNSAEYSFKPQLTGEYELTFTATDIWGEAVSHKVTLKAENSTKTYDVQVKLAESLTPEFFTTKGFDENGYDLTGDVLTAKAGEKENDFVTYTVKVPENIKTISVRAKDTDNNVWGGTYFDTEKEMEPVVMRQVQAVVKDKINIDNTPVTPTSAQVEFQIKNNVTAKYIESGSNFVEENGYLAYRFLLIAADNDITYTCYTKPLGDVAESYGINQANNKTLRTDSAEVQIIPLDLKGKSEFAITAPTNALVEMFCQTAYYTVSELPVMSTTDNRNGTKTVVFNTSVASGTCMFRVSMNGEITKAGYVGAGQESITLDWKGDTRGPKYSEPYDTSTSYGQRGDDSMYVNINYRNNLLLDKDETFQLKAYRIWEIINSDTGNIMIEPDFHYEIISGEDIISITPSEGCSGNAKNNWLDVKGLKEGTAVVEITYDALDLVSGNDTSWGGSEAIEKFTFNASDPARTALIVVQVGKEKTDIDFGIKSSSGKAWDAEHDTLYFIGENGEIEFTPTVSTGKIKSVGVSSDKGETYTQLTAKDGVYTAKIESGNNIIRIEKEDGAVSYQLVRGDKITYTISEVEKYSDGDGILDAGERIRVKFNGVHNTIGKMSGIYNPADYQTNYTFNGEKVSSNATGGFAGIQYSYPAAAYVLLTLPGAANEGDQFVMTDGYTSSGGWGSSGGAHRDVKGEVAPGLNSSTTSGVYNIFPDITLTIGEEITKVNNIKVSGVTISKETLELAVGNATTLSATFTPSNATDKTVKWTSSDETVATVENGKVTAVKEGTAVITVTTTDGGFTDECAVTVTAASTEDKELDFGLSEIKGYVTISFVDEAIRVPEELGSIADEFKEPLGIIIEPVKVPFAVYDNIATVTLRLLDAMAIDTEYTGSVDGNFYLSQIKGFTTDGVYHETLGEFIVGQGSGWMITWNEGGKGEDWFIDQGASEFLVTDGDIIKWQYTCQLGADIGDMGYMEDVYKVEEYINAIGTPITLEKEAAIVNARTEYDKLIDAQKTAVFNYDLLVTAEKALANLKATAEDIAAAKVVDEMIAAIGNVTEDSKEAIEAARVAYNGLTDLQKMLVDGETLETAENLYNQLLNNDKLEDIYKVTGDYLENLGIPAVGSTGGEWMVIGLARGNKGLSGTTTNGYYNGVSQYIDTVFSGNKTLKNTVRLHENKSTDNSRVILALTAAGIDATNVNGYNLFDGLNEMSYIKYQGINGPMWALIALNSHPSYKNKLSGDVTEEKLIQAVLDSQLNDRGWDLANKTADADMTAMAVQALAPYYNSNSAVKEAVDKALSKLSSMQQNNGSFASVDGVNAESTAQVIVALTSLGINPEEDSRFIKKGMSPVDALCNFAVNGGGFMHTPNTARDGMATEQGYYALVSYFRLLNGQKSLYDMSDVALKIGKINPDAPSAYDIAKANEVEKLISAIGKVTLYSNLKIEAARKAYDKLTAIQKKQVENYDVLVDAEKKYEKIVDEAVEKVEDLIYSIGEVTLESGEDITAARRAYNQLPPHVQKLVKNLKMLEKAEKEYKKLREEALELIRNGKTVLTKSELLELQDKFENVSEKTKYDDALALLITYFKLGEKQQLALAGSEQLETLKAIVAKQNHENPMTGITMYGLEWNIKVKTDKLPEKDKHIKDDIISKLEGAQMLTIWDIYLEDVLTGKGHTLDDVVEVCIPVDLIGDYTFYDRLGVVHYADDGSIEVLNCKIVDGYVVFNAVDFSYYAIVGFMDAENESEMTTGTVVVDTPEYEELIEKAEEIKNADNSWLVWAGTAGVGIVLLAVLLVLKKCMSKES